MVDLALQVWTLLNVCSNLCDSVKKGEFAGTELSISVSKKIPYQM